MDREIIRLLKSSDPDDRMEGIESLVDSGHPDTLKILASLHKKETDPEVKQLAAQMARQVKDNELLDDGFIADEKPKHSEKAKTSSGAERVGWGKALAGIGVYALLNPLAIAIPVAIFGAAVMTVLLVIFDDDPSLANISGGMFATFVGIIAVVIIIFTFIGIFINYGLIHFSATTFLGGKGYFTNLLWNMHIPLIALSVVQVVIGGLMIFFAFSSLANFDATAFEAAMKTGDASYIDDNANIIQALNALNGLVSLGFLIWASIVIGKTYEFSGIKGCLSIMISGIIMFVTICGCYFAIFINTV